MTCDGSNGNIMANCLSRNGCDLKELRNQLCVHFGTVTIYYDQRRFVFHELVSEKVTSSTTCFAALKCNNYQQKNFNFLILS
ncbi:hypothetical protein L5515_017336 [Caenorhabditis briggsae]|uniref:Uncharacterized protein n=1 Tax=Caenorhabditis briggsae TaxID=6238 RepID=A0AAE9FEB6_CAEBR|nr:hypothetical protein L5515_017336 [Caenorhabditis briggsae]